MNRASILSIIAGGLVYWVLEGTWMGLVMMEHYKAAMAPYSSVMNSMEDGNPAMWLITTMITAALMMWFTQRGSVTVASTATVGAVMLGTFTFMMEFSMNMFFANYPFIPTSLYSVAWEIVAGGITGAAMGFIYGKLNKTA
ncbi:MAG: hypothetical protein IPH85_06275 [Ignavibacteria bacterium]|nr:hypothetical protein [Ignavibacteria bacterium]MBP7093367.1 hypothetical protein [Candidatus Kapabacteria bacterium]MBK6417839.1 hypothetical protein [Ignavibacteria bacterium]MBK7185526.1 hypothetical protein [Ignavibacteria bacterium]MBK7411346.1 hypothetical protein [Ignavibacteria bacterium]